MKRSRKYILLLTAVLLASCQFSDNGKQIDLQGYWQYKFSAGAAYADSLLLPGTTDLNKKGILNTKMDETDNLTRPYTYEGKAWYRRSVDIPKQWEGQEVTLYMERTKPSQVYVDGRLMGSSTDISTPQVYDLSAALTPGRHELTVMVDNGKCIPTRIVTKSHMYTDATQTNWNGIIGDFRLEAHPPCHIDAVQVHTDLDRHTATLQVGLKGSGLATRDIQISCKGHSWNTAEKHTLRKVSATVHPGTATCTLVLDLGEGALTWSEFHPALYRVTVSMKSGGMEDEEVVTFGLREFKRSGTRFQINDKITYLRGKHEGCVFPLRGHAAMDVDSWRKRFRIAKQYGINHYRCHSWCPPRACFEAADLEGIYLQPETPYWGTIRAKDTVLVNFMTKEGVNINREYGNHASYVMFALGNELSGPDSVRRQIMDVIRKDWPDRLYAYGSNNGCGYIPVQEEEDYYTTCRIGGGYDALERHTRASFAFCDAYDAGAMNHNYPNTRGNFDHAVSLCPRPIISHETGQYQVYPNFDEMKKYTGVTEARNFAVFKKRLEDAGMGHQAHDFLMASGKWAAELYLAEIEMCLRTRNFGGFQLLDLQDYPGQGTALVGILDAFMESKGLILPEEWRRSCCEVVPLFEADSYTHFADRPLTGDIAVANYSEQTLEGNLHWTLKNASAGILAEGVLQMEAPQGDVVKIGSLNVDISKVQRAEKCILSLDVESTPYCNEYPVWIYPAHIDQTPASNVEVCHRWSQARSALKQGRNVIWFPDRGKLGDKTVGGLFITDFWNYRMFYQASVGSKRTVSPGTLGLLMDPGHPLFRNFPTASHTEWQWFPIIKESYPMILDELPRSYFPIIQVIDNIDRNHKLGLLYEMQVGDGRLLVCMADLEVYPDKPETQQFKSALLQYAASKEFRPELKLSLQEVESFFRP